MHDIHVHTCDIHTTHGQHTPLRSLVDDELKVTLLWLHTVELHSVQLEFDLLVVTEAENPSVIVVVLVQCLVY